MTLYKLGLLTLAVCLASSSVLAVEVHSWHQVRAIDGHWRGELVNTSSHEYAYFTDAEGHFKGRRYDFQLQPNLFKPFVYGVSFGKKADFDVSYVLTINKVRKPSGGLGFSTPTCQYDISAKAPADPDVRVEEYHGAHCDYKIRNKVFYFTVG